MFKANRKNTENWSHLLNKTHLVQNGFFNISTVCKILIQDLFFLSDKCTISIHKQCHIPLLKGNSTINK